MTGFIESPNKWVGRFGYKPEAIVIHITDGNYKGAHSWLLNPRSEVSAHFIVKDDGKYDALVKPKDAAWHVGVVVRPTWKLLKKGVNPNLYTLGIELALTSKQRPTKRMIRTLTHLITGMAHRFNIPLDRDHIIGHREIRANKTCPGQFVSVDALVWWIGLRA